MPPGGLFLEGAPLYWDGGRAIFWGWSQKEFLNSRAPFFCEISPRTSFFSSFYPFSCHDLPRFPPLVPFFPLCSCIPAASLGSVSTTKTHPPPPMGDYEERANSCIWIFLLFTLLFFFCQGLGALRSPPTALPACLLPPSNLILPNLLMPRYTLGIFCTHYLLV